MPSATPSSANDLLGDPALRKSLLDFVRRRVPSADVDDVVQTVLMEALASPSRPEDPSELRRWVLGIARHKVVDFHRRATREPPTELPDIEGSPAPIEARSLARWAEEQAGDAGEAQKTLAWMAREGEGEKLEAIAAEEQVPAARVRQRVSRMRRWMKERWTAELAAVAMLTLIALAAWWILRGEEKPTTDKGPLAPPTIAPEPPSPLERARALRADALRACDRGAWRVCLDGLDEARGLDPEGDREPAVGAARAKAEEELRAAPTSATPQSTAPPKSTAPAPSPTGALPQQMKPTVAPPSPKEPIFDKKELGEKDSYFDKKGSTPKPVEPKGTVGTGGTGGKPMPGGKGGKAVKKVMDPETY